jgi:hypothetical protein
MPSSIRAQARHIAALAIAVATACTAALVGAPPATAQPAGVYHYHPNDLRYHYDGQHGSFTGDVIYASQDPTGGNRLLWSLRLSPSVQAIVRGPMSCGAVVEGKRGYNDYHGGIPADYWWHSVVTDLRLDTTYRLRARCAFTATNGHHRARKRAIHCRIHVAFDMNRISNEMI